MPAFVFLRFQLFLDFPSRVITKVTDPGLGKGLSGFFPVDLLITRREECSADS